MKPMKRRTILGTGAVVFALAMLCLFGSGRSQPAPGAGAPAPGPRLAFDKGIGFYAFSDGKLTWLDYPLYDPNIIRQERRLVSRDDFRLFSYGIDFSRPALLLPPHLQGFGVVLQDVQVNVDSPDFARRRFEERQGPYAVHFIPLEGYGHPVYEITCDLWDGLRKPGVPPAIWGFQVSSGNTPDVFWFAFAND